VQIPSFHGAFRDTAVSYVQFGLQIWHAGTQPGVGLVTFFSHGGIGFFSLGQDVGAGTRAAEDGDHVLKRIMLFLDLQSRAKFDHLRTD